MAVVQVELVIVHCCSHVFVSVCEPFLFEPGELHKCEGCVGIASGYWNVVVELLQQDRTCCVFISYLVYAGDIGGSSYYEWMYF